MSFGIFGREFVISLSKAISMTHSLLIASPLKIDINALLRALDVEMEYAWGESPDGEGQRVYYLWQPKHSTTVFVIERADAQHVRLSMDALASWPDYRLFPYLADCLSAQLRGEGIAGIFQRYDEDWIALAIGETVAAVKVHLSLGRRYYLHQPLEPFQYIDASLLASVAVSHYSATPRIYGYIQYLLRGGRVPTALDTGFAPEDSELLELEVDVPQHVSIGRVRSWQTDGSETWESFAQEDVDMLLQLAATYDGQADGVVLNDLGTIYQEGIGVACDGQAAARWWREAIAQGDLTFAPNNLGDLYRKGCEGLAPDLRIAAEAYASGTDPYATYRLGQAAEEGWCTTPDLERAKQLYRLAAQRGHHRGIKRCEELHIAY